VESQKDRPRKDVDSNVFPNWKMLHHPRVGPYKDDVSNVKGRSEIVELVLIKMGVLEYP